MHKKLHILLLGLLLSMVSALAVPVGKVRTHLSPKIIDLIISDKQTLSDWVILGNQASTATLATYAQARKLCDPALLKQLDDAVYQSNNKTQMIADLRNANTTEKVEAVVRGGQGADELAINYAGDLGEALAHIDILINNLSDGLKTLANNYKKIGRVEKGAENVILFRNANNEVVGKIIDNKFYLVHSGWSGDIAMNETRRTTILGKYNEDKPGGTHSLLKTGLPNTNLTGKVDYRILSSSEIDNLFTQAQVASDAGNFALADKLFEQAWEINRQWLDEAIESNDVIRLISEPNHVNLNLKNNKGETVLSFFGREKSYFESKGYIQQGYEFIKK